MVRRGNTQIYVTRGVGEGIPLRFGARPQITLITLKASSE
jgi:predicted MPP superfamily phosphohydrolase